MMNTDTSNRRIETPTITDPMALISGVMPRRMVDQIYIGRVLSRPVGKKVTGISSNERVNEMSDEPIRAFIAWDYENLSNFKIIRSKILLAMPCLYDRQRVTELKRTFWDSQAVQGIADNLNKNNAAANKLSALFIYSMVDTGHGIYTLLELQKQRMNGNNKGPNSYDEIIFEHTRIQGPPWRTRNSEWPMMM